MSRKHLAMALGLLTLLAGGAGTAVAAGEQVVGQEAASAQSAGSTATSTQQAPSNENIDVRIFSPGDSGNVTQTNSSAALAGAGNANTTGQSASQAGGQGGVQAAGQTAASSQSAGAQAMSTQTKPGNTNISVRIDSPGDNGNVTQTNDSTAIAAAGNHNDTTQSADQAQAGGPCCPGTGSGSQAVGQTADSQQRADAGATSTQTKPGNTNISVRIDSPGDNGNVTQTNDSTAIAAAGNHNDTTQTATQQQAGGACCAAGGTQAIGQAAGNHQGATAGAASSQVAPSNTNVPVRIGSPGDDGTVTQANSSQAGAVALNGNALEQAATQSQAGGAGVQAIGQSAGNRQDAGSAAASTQYMPSNVNTPVRIGSAGADGDVTQSNVSAAGSVAANGNATSQSASQSQAGDRCCLGTGVQAIGQQAWNAQSAVSSASASQTGAQNVNAPVRIGSAGGGGSVDQANLSTAGSAALNGNALEQEATQRQGGGLGTSVQAIGQKAASAQHAGSSATATQEKPSNANTPVRIGSAGGDGSVSQDNTSLALSAAVNLNHTTQSATQSQSGACCRPVLKMDAPQPYGCGCSGTGVQAIGQFALNRQDAGSSANAGQYMPSNANAPVRIGSAGSGGVVSQSNVSLAASLALNANALSQYATQRSG